MKLKCCPFCGTKPEVNTYEVFGATYKRIECSTEGCITYLVDEGFSTLKQATKAWNRRTKSKKTFTLNIETREVT